MPVPSTRTEKLDAGDIVKLNELIRKNRESFHLDIITNAFGLIFLLVLLFFTLAVDSVLWTLMLLLIIIPLVLSILAHVNYKKGIKSLVKDLETNKKIILRSKIDGLGTRTKGFTIPLPQIHTLSRIYKSFSYFIGAGGYIYLTNGKDYPVSFKINDQVFLEVAVHSKYVFSIKKVDTPSGFTTDTKS